MINDVSKSPFFDISNCRDLFKKLEWDFTSLTRENMNPYYLMNFLTTSNHLQDWVLNDKLVSMRIKKDLRELFDLRRNKEFSIVKSLCNRSKHFEKDIYDYNKVKVDGFSFAHMDFRSVNFGGKKYFVLTENGRVNIYDICEKNFRDWNNFFQFHDEEFAKIGYKSNYDE